MRSLTDEEAKIFFEKLSKYIGSNVKHLLVRQDEEYVFRLHKQRVYYIKRALLRLASTVGKNELKYIGTCFGKFTKSRKFHLQVSCLAQISKYALYKMWLRPSGQQSFLYGKHVLKSHLARMTENIPVAQGIVIFSSSDTPLGLGVSMRTTVQCRSADPTTIVAINQCDIGQYLRSEQQ